MIIHIYNINAYHGHAWSTWKQWQVASCKSERPELANSALGKKRVNKSRHVLIPISGRQLG